MIKESKAQVVMKCMDELDVLLGQLSKIFLLESVLHVLVPVGQDCLLLGLSDHIDVRFAKKPWPDQT